MNCPKCARLLNRETIGNIEVDQCEQCFGVWFDKDELRKSKDIVDPDLNWMDFDLWKHKDRFSVSAKAGKCPHCNIDMVAIEYDKTGIQIDHCTQCQGVWLDAGEFEKIIESLADELLAKRPLEYLKATLTEAKEIITGKEGLISEWRDFCTTAWLMQLRVFAENPNLANAILTFQRNNPVQ